MLNLSLENRLLHLNSKRLGPMRAENSDQSQHLGNELTFPLPSFLVPTPLNYQWGGGGWE